MDHAIVDPLHLIITIAVALVAVAGLVWRVGAWFLNRLEKSIGTLDEKFSKLGDKVDNLSNSVFELKGEVKGRNYAEMEQFIKDLQKEK